MCGCHSRLVQQVYRGSPLFMDSQGDLLPVEKKEEYSNTKKALNENMLRKK